MNEPSTNRPARSRAVGDQVSVGMGVAPPAGHAHVAATWDVGPNLAYQQVGVERTGATDPRAVSEASSASTLNSPGPLLSDDDHLLLHKWLGREDGRVPQDRESQKIIEDGVSSVAAASRQDHKAPPVH